MIVNVSNENLFELLSVKCCTSFDLNCLVNPLLREQVSAFVRKAQHFDCIQLYGHVFELPNFALRFEHAYARIYQLLRYGFTNENWRSYTNYTRFHNDKEAHQFLLNEYLRGFRSVFDKHYNKRYNEHFQLSQKRSQYVLVERFLTSESVHTGSLGN